MSQQIGDEIERLRKKLNDMATNVRLTDQGVLETSQQLDNLLNKYMDFASKCKEAV